MSTCNLPLIKGQAWNSPHLHFPIRKSVRPNFWGKKYIKNDEIKNFNWLMHLLDWVITWSNDLKTFVFFSAESKVQFRTDMNIPKLELRNFEFIYTRSVDLPEFQIKISTIFTFYFLHLKGRCIVLAFSDIIFPIGRSGKVVSLTPQMLHGQHRPWMEYWSVTCLQGELKGMGSY